MGVLSGERRQWTPEPIIPPYPGAQVFGGSNVGSNPDTAMQIPTVWACVQLIAGSVSMLPLETYRRTNDVPARITDPQIVTAPDSTMTQSAWINMLMVSLLLRGNAYGLIASRDVLGRATQIVLLNPDQVVVQVDPNTGNVKYLVGSQRVDRTADMWHLPGLTLPGSKIGMSPISFAAQTIATDQSARKFGQNFFDGGGIPKAVLTSSMDVTQQQAVMLKARLVAATQNREPVVLGSGVEYNAISVKPEESQFLATQKANISDIARYFGIPAEMVGGESGSSMTYSNVEQRSLDFLTYCIGPWLRRVEDAFFNLLPQPQYVSFDTDQLLRTDAETQAKVRVSYVAGKILPPSRILSQMDEKPLTQAEKDELELVPLTVTPGGAPKALPNPPTALTSDDTPNVDPTSPPKLGLVNG